MRKVHNYIILKSPNSRPRIRLLHWFPAQASAQSSCPENPDESTSDESLIILSIISKNFTDIWIFGYYSSQFWTNLRHQIILRHKYCESPTQVGLVFKNIEYLPEEEIWQLE